MANVLELMDYVQQQGDKGRERGKQSRLSELSSQAYGAHGEQRNALVQQAIGVDPQAGMALGDKLQGRENDKRQKLAGAAKYMLGAVESQNPAATQGAWRAVRPFLEELVGPTGKVVPDQWSDDMLPALHQAIAAAGGQAQGGAMVRRTIVGADGQYYNVLSDNTMSPTGIMANPNIKVMEQAGTTPYGVVTSGGVAGSVVPLGGGQPQGQQRAPGEVPFSIDPSLPPQVQASIRANESQWAQAPDMGSVQIQSQAPQGQAGPVRTPTAGEISAQQAQGKANVEFANYDRMTELVADRAAAEQRAKDAAAADSRDRYGSPEARKQQQEAAKKLPQLQNAVRIVGRIESALKSLDMPGVNTGPLDQYAVRALPSGQELEAAVGSIQNSMLALTRVPGVGSQSDLEQRVAQLQYPALDKAPEVNARTMENLRLFVRDLEAAYQNVLSGQGQPAPQQPAQGDQFQGFRVLD